VVQNKEAPFKDFRGEFPRQDLVVGIIRKSVGGYCNLNSLNK
jgi:hypothetical protein